MDLMKDQGIPYGEQVSAPNNFAELNMLAIDLFGRPYDQLSDGEQETLMDFIGSKSQAGGKGIMQMASGYKSDIEEMYEQYVFEMEEMGLQPMSFSEFVARERAGMARGGRMRGPDYFLERINDLASSLETYEMADELARAFGYTGNSYSFELYPDLIDRNTPERNPVLNRFHDLN